MKFVVGDLPEIIEDEIDGDPAPVAVKLPVTINGRIFPREDVDVYAFRAKKAESIRCSVQAATIGSPLDARLEVRDSQGRRIAESDAPTGSDPALSFIAPADGEYQVRIDDMRAQGGQAFVYRLTITADPFVERVFPLGGKRGSTVEVEVTGQAMPAKLNITIPKDAPSNYQHPFSARGKSWSGIVLDVDDHPEFIAARDMKNTLSLPAILNGRIEKPGQIDEWKWQAKKGETWEFELRAARFGSKLDGVITICDAQGKPLTKAEATAADCTARLTAPADGAYIVKVQDRFQSRGGPEFAYRLRIVPPPLPDFRLTLAGDPRQPNSADAVTLPRKGQAKLKLNIDRIGSFKEPIALEVIGLPAHVSVTPNVIQPNQASIDLTFKADEKAKIDVSRITIVGKVKESKVEGSLREPVSARGASGLHSTVLLAVAMPTPFVIKGEYDMGFAPRGAVHKRKYKIERNGYDGPIEVSLADRQARHLQGVEGPRSSYLRALANSPMARTCLLGWKQAALAAFACRASASSRTRTAPEHRVSLVPSIRTERLVAVVGPACSRWRRSERRTPQPGKQFTVAVKVQRGQGIAGPVNLELVTPSHQHGLTATKTTLSAKEDRGTLMVTCAGKLTGPFNMPVIVRATLMRDGDPVVAEVKIDIQP